MGRVDRRARRHERGAALVEFALVAPIFFTLFFGIVEMGQVFTSWVSVQHASELGARYAVTGRDSCASGGAGRVGCVISESKTGVAHLPNGVSATVNVRSWAFPTYSVMTADSAGLQCDAVEVEVRYTHVLTVPMISAIFPNPTLVGRQRFINEPFGTCDDTP